MKCCGSQALARGEHEQKLSFSTLELETLSLICNYCLCSFLWVKEQDQKMLS